MDQPSDKLPTTSQTECRMCGTCCEKGGPALHTQDLDRLGSGGLDPAHLITIRKDELAIDPARNRPMPVKHELVKIRGRKGTWQCCFYDRSKKQCTIYDNRPQACRVLKCWDTSDVLALAGRDLISRIDVIGKDHPLAQRILTHEKRCPCPDMTRLAQEGHVSGKTIKTLEKLIAADLDFRTQAVTDLNLSVEEEMFAFGRPVFQLLESIGFTVAETPRGLKLSCRPKVEPPSGRFR
ncbi:MAG: YkgJ family cysteine cluster protein [Pseudomonadota bacterium]